MKTIFSLLLVLTASACISNRKASEKTSQSLAWHTQRALTTQAGYHKQEQHRWDSMIHYWYFATARPFYYHPDSGLYAENGTLLTGTESLRRQINLQDTFSATLMLRDSSVAVETMDYQYRGIDRVAKNWKVYACCLLCALLLIGVWYRKR